MPLPLLLTTAAAAGALHTAVGLDHTLPFILMARAQSWSLGKLWAVTLLCGAGHVLSSVLLGLVGIWLGLAAERMDWIDSARGHAASWLLIGLGLAYAAWGIYRERRQRRHTHVHVHPNGTAHLHEHAHHQEHLHVHGAGDRPITVGFLFLVLIFGPCELLVPLLMVSSAQHSWTGALAVTVCFSLATLGTMLLLVTLGFAGLQTVRLSGLAPYGHTLAGLLLAATGAAVRLFGV